MSSFLLEIPQ